MIAFPLAFRRLCTCLPFVLVLILLGGGLGVPARAAEAPGAPKPAEPDELVFPDGDRASGTFLRREEGTIVFKTRHFGEVRVKESDVKLILAAAPPAPSPANANAIAATGRTAADTSEAVGGEEEPAPWYHLRSTDLAKSLRAFFGPWKGRVALSSEIVTNSNERSAVAVDATMQRKWKRDEVKLNLRYDYAETNDLTSTDLLRGDASWNHSLGKRFYTVYSPKVEWNKMFRNSAGAYDDYVLLQQEVGLGWSVQRGKRGKVSVGVSENFFNVWILEDDAAVSRRVESVFVDTEWRLPWQVTLTDRGLMYPTSEGPGWENRLQLNKKLSETISVGLSHELRRNNPDVRVADYTKLKMMFGLDF